MSLLPRLCLLLALASATLGCQVAPETSGPDGVTPNAVAGDAIEVTALDTPSAAPEAIAPASLPSAPEQAAPPAPEAEVATPAPVPGAPEAEATDEAAAEAAAAEATEAEAAPPPPPKSERQIACERKRGNWVDTGKGTKICQFTTRDGGKSCTRESQCEGLCLARSRTCAPVTPLMGCQEILQDDGSRATQCIE